MRAAMAETGANTVAQSLYDRALERVRQTPGIETWEIGRATRPATELRTEPFNLAYMAKVRSACMDEIDADRSQSLRNLVKTGHVFHEMLVRADGSFDTAERRVADKLTGSAPDYVDGSFIDQLSKALLQW